MEKENTEFDFATSDFNGFYYTNDKQIRKMDDAIILSKFTEKYPDFDISSGENLLKQVFMIIVRDTRLIKEVIKTYDISVKELFGIFFRNYTFLFNGAYTIKLHKLIVNRAYAKLARNRKSSKHKRVRRVVGETQTNR